MTDNNRKKINRERKRINKNRVINQDIYKVSVLFAVFAFSMMAFLAFFLAFKADSVINNTYNKRSEELKKVVQRGSIYSSAGDVLAYSEICDGVETRIYPYSNLFSHVVGFENKGGLGLESSYNFTLLSSHINLFDKISNEFNGIKNPGDSIYTTLDMGLQQFISSQLGWNYGAAIAIDPSTGAILSDVSKPDFDPNTIDSIWDSIILDTENSPLVNRATQGAYTPGSTFKLFTLLEYLRENQNVDDYSYDCYGTIIHNDNSLSCYGQVAHGTESLVDSFANSCNCSFANIGLTLNNTRFKSNNDSMLFNSIIDIDIAYNPSSFSLDENSSDFMIMQTAIGQGETVTNPLHLALVMSAIANNGILMKPHFVTSVVNPYGKEIKTFKNTEYKKLLSSEETAKINTYLNAVVTQGTGYILSWNNYSAYGKTGTAETNSVKELNYDHSWFVGYAEMDGKKLVLCILLENLETAGYAAVDIAKNVFDFYFSQM